MNFMPHFLKMHSG